MRNLGEESWMGRWMMGGAGGKMMEEGIPVMTLEELRRIM